MSYMASSRSLLPPAYSLPVLDAVCRFCGIQRDYPLLASASQKIADDPGLVDFACSLYGEFTSGEKNFVDCHLPPDKLDKETELIFELTALSGIPAAIERYRQKGIAEDIIAATLALTPGKRIQPVQLGYCRNYYRAEIYRLGRFHFKRHKDKRNLPAVLTSRKNPKKKVLLANDQTLCDDQGFMDLEKPAWIARTTVTDKMISGNLINPDGTVSRERAVFAFDEWTLRYGAREVIDMHIPAGGGMTAELSRTSLKKAFAFFDIENPVIYCDSWIFNPGLRNLPGTDNICALAEMGRLFTTRSTGKDGMFFLFGRETDDISSLPQCTTLQRSVTDYMRRGGKLRSCGIFFFEDEI